MATAAPIFPMSGHSQFDYFCFDPQIDYAQVLAEAQWNQDEEEATSLSPFPLPDQRAPRRGDFAGGDATHFSAHLRAVDKLIQKSSAEDLKKRKSWKSSLFFWRKSSQKKHNRAIPATQPPVFKSRAKPTSGPIYMNDIQCIAPSYRSGRSNSGSMAAMFGVMQRGEADVPYMPLSHHSHSSRAPLSRPIYLVT
jgi:hypothetical protein